MRADEGLSIGCAENVGSRPKRKEELKGLGGGEEDQFGSLERVLG